MEYIRVLGSKTCVCYCLLITLLSSKETARIFRNVCPEIKNHLSTIRNILFVVMLVLKIQIKKKTERFTQLDIRTLVSCINNKNS